MILEMLVYGVIALLVVTKLLDALSTEQVLTYSEWPYADKTVVVMSR